MLLKAGLCFVCSSGASHGDVFFEHTEHTLWRKISAYWSCIVIFLAEVCFVCSGEASHRDIRFEHIDNAFWFCFVCLFDLILYVPSTIFQLYRDGSSWVEPVLS